MTSAYPISETQRPAVLLTRGEVAWGGLALLAVPVYVNAVVIWRWLEANLPAPVLGAIPLILALGLAAALYLGHGPRVKLRPAHATTWLLAALVLAGVAWALTDPRFPAKRVHIFEYALLAVVARQFFRERLADPMAIGAGAVAAAILGVHDELLQGLHPGRFFAPVDIMVNAVSACAGGAMILALRGPTNAMSGSGFEPRHWLVLVASFVGLAGFIYCLAGDLVWRNALSLGLPLLGLGVWLLVSRDGSSQDGVARFVAVIMGLSATAAAAPSVSKILDLPFA